MEYIITYFMHRCVDSEERVPCEISGCRNSAAYIVIVPPSLDMQIALCESCAKQAIRRRGLLKDLYIKAAKDADKYSRVSANNAAESLRRMQEIKETLSARARTEIFLGDKPTGAAVDIDD